MSDHSRRRLGMVLVVAGLFLAAALDLPVLAWTNRHSPEIEHRDLTQFLRTGGYVPMWLGVAAAIALEETWRAGRWSLTSARRGIMLAVAVSSSGIVAECLKLICRRQRPGISKGEWYSFRSFWDRPFASGGLSMPSSHAIIAFTGAFMLARYYPGAKVVFLLFAVGTAFSRVCIGAHYVSDVYVSMLLGWGIAAISQPRQRAKS